MNKAGFICFVSKPRAETFGSSDFQSVVGGALKA